MGRSFAGASREFPSSRARGHVLLACGLVAAWLGFAGTARAAIEVVDTAGWLDGFYNTSLAVVDGQPAILYYQSWPISKQRYARYDGTQWVKTTISGVGIGRCLTEVDGRPAFLNYRSDANLQLWAETASGWSISDIPNSYKARGSDLAHVAGELAAAYTSQGGGSVYYATYDGSDWSSERIVQGRDWMSGGPVGLADIGGQPAVAYRGGWAIDGTPGWPTRLYYAEYTGSDWAISGPLATDIGSLALTEYLGDPVLVYESGSTIRMSVRDSGVWESSIVDTGLSMGLSVVPWGDQLVVSHIRRLATGSPWEVRLGFLRDGTWSFTTIDTVTQLDENLTSLAIVNGSPAVAYESHYNYGQLRYFSQTQVIPEPPAVLIWSLLGLAGVGMHVYRRRRAA